MTLLLYKINLTNICSPYTYSPLLPGFFPETNFSTSFKTIAVYLADKQVELALVHYELCKIRSFHQDAKSTNQQNKRQNCIFMEILFQNDLYFTGTWTYQVRLPIPSMQLLRPVFRYTADNYNICVVPPQSWGDRSDTKHSKCLLLGGRRLNQLTLIPKPKGSGSTRAATAQVGPANKRNDTKRCLPVEASLRPGEAVPW